MIYGKRRDNDIESEDWWEYNDHGKLIEKRSRIHA